MTKIDIFSGFLGAGKTTLIKKLIQEAYQGRSWFSLKMNLAKSALTAVFCRMPAWRSRR